VGNTFLNYEEGIFDGEGSALLIAYNHFIRTATGIFYTEGGRPTYIYRNHFESEDTGIEAHFSTVDVVDNYLVNYQIEVQSLQRKAHYYLFTIHYPTIPIRLMPQQRSNMNFPPLLMCLLMSMM
ncbi:MAG: hypothetical protein D6675_05190, partial [Gemmatimonadetes bacterium]